ncbi:hypothetical protein [Paeniglutamicibacter gangotriensis]|uniref:Uncharacterized protein n=1 Tax=Paeniglutamicibacter gangotriensis Lz1y TaxID=1276920 RepID=M7MVP9_9MICC|nr:hypothetical protein [Paeniglutamicibacter gangotriensis]EMQ99121.1 hypothetical protein ADIAG_01111 [Paeniglutamicibacter gangotriensis Lz1y]
MIEVRPRWAKTVLAAVSATALVLGLGMGLGAPAAAAPVAVTAVPAAVEADDGSQMRFKGNPDPEGFFCPDQPVTAGELGDYWQWEPTAAPQLVYQWYRDDTPIAGARTDEYWVQGVDLGHRLWVEVIAQPLFSNTGAVTTRAVGTKKEVKPCATYPVAPGYASVGGSSVVGGTVEIDGHISPGVHVDYYWTRVGDGQLISTASRLRLGLEHYDQEFSLRAVFTKQGAWPVERIYQTFGVSPADLVAKSESTITGALRTGAKLTVKDGKFNVAGVHLDHFQWHRNGQPIKGATGRSYTLTHADAGKRMYVTMEAFAHGYTNISTWAGETTTVSGGSLLAKGKPTISGTASAGLAVAVTKGSWNFAPTSYSYQWYRSGKAIKGATKPTYKLTGTDVGRKITAKVSAKRYGYKTGSVTTAARTVSSAAIKPVGKPKISGTIRRGSTVMATKGSWNITPTSYAYQWYRSGKAIKGATKPKYKITTTDIGRKITAKVSAKRHGFRTGSATTAARTAAGTAFKSVGRPKISGTKKVGYTLTAKPGIASPQATSYSYQWYRDGKAIKGATKKAYKLRAADEGSDMTVKVAAKRAHYSSTSRTSHTAVVAWGPAPDSGGSGGHSSGKAPNRCYYPGGRDFYYC